MGNERFEEVLQGRIAQRPRWIKIAERLLWFWPRVVDASIWIDAKRDPTPFRAMTTGSHMLVDEVLAHAVSPNDRILDLGCNCGRHLAPLAEAGYRRLFGVDVNERAIEVMPDWFPVLRDVVTAKADFFQRYLSNTIDGAFDIVFSRGATVELVHPSYPLVKELTRVANRHVILLIEENGHAYPRFWTHEFAREGFVLTKLLRPVDPYLEQDLAADRNNSLMVYSRLSHN